MMEPPTTAAIIVNWNGWKYTLACLKSLAALHGGSPAYIIVCDNGSTDESVENILSWARSAFGHQSVITLCSSEILKQGEPLAAKSPFTLIRNSCNQGFAAGNNHGIRLALSFGVDFIWLLNNDTQAHPYALEPLLQYAKDFPVTGIIGSTIVYHQPEMIVQCAGGCTYSPATTFASYVMGNKPLDEVLKHNAAIRLSYVYGASMFIRAEVFRRVGLLNEEYFLFCEELDLCDRAKSCGFELAWCRESIVVHHQGATVGKDLTDLDRAGFAIYHETLSTLKYTSTFHPRLLPFAIASKICIKMVALCKTAKWHSALIRPIFHACRDFFAARRDRSL